jgi:hypothetical protein
MRSAIRCPAHSAEGEGSEPATLTRQSWPTSQVVRSQTSEGCGGDGRRALWSSGWRAAIVVPMVRGR